MKISCAGAVAILVGHSSAFKFNPSLIDVPRTRKGNSAAVAPNSIRSPNLNVKRRTGIRMSRSENDEDSSQRSRNEEEKVVTSRRAALRQCSSIFAATFASALNLKEANASEFAETPVPGVIVEQPPIEGSGPQFYDQNVIVPPRPKLVTEGAPSESDPISPESAVAIVRVETPESSTNLPEPPVSATMAFNPPPTVAPQAELTLENSQVVQIPVANSAASVAPKAQSKSNSGSGGPMAIVEVGGVTAVLSALFSAVSGRVQGNTDELSPKCKVVMIENEPYGLDTGRRWFNGVDVTINDPVPASDVREYCEAGVVNDVCSQTITGFLGDISTKGSQDGGAPSAEQQETANVVLSYLNSLNGDSPHNSETATAFSSYLNVLSNGEVNAPASPELVAGYLDSVSKDGVERLSTVENRINRLESSVNQLPEEISGRITQWQEQQDKRLANELTKIESFLVNANKSEYPSSTPVNGEDYQSRVPFS